MIDVSCIMFDFHAYYLKMSKYWVTIIRNKILQLLSAMFLHCVPKTWTTKLMTVTLSNVNRFSTLFHCYTRR